MKRTYIKVTTICLPKRVKRVVKNLIPLGFKIEILLPHPLKWEKLPKSSGLFRLLQSTTWHSIFRIRGFPRPTTLLLSQLCLKIRILDSKLSQKAKRTGSIIKSRPKNRFRAGSGSKLLQHRNRICTKFP